jgi:hypothetical protein
VLLLVVVVEQRSAVSFQQSAKDNSKSVNAGTGARRWLRHSPSTLPSETEKRRILSSSIDTIASSGGGGGGGGATFCGLSN